MLGKLVAVFLILASMFVFILPLAAAAGPQPTKFAAL